MSHEKLAWYHIRFGSYGVPYAPDPAHHEAASVGWGFGAFRAVLEFFGGLVCLFDGLRTGSSGVSPNADAGENTALVGPQRCHRSWGGGGLGRIEY